MTIRKQLLVAAGVAVLASATLGAYAALGVSQLNDLVKKTYDNALMASTFAQSAQTDFVRLDRALRRAATARDKAELDQQEKIVEDAAKTFVDDLGVVRARALSPKAGQLVAEITAKFEASAAGRKDTLARARQRVEAGKPADPIASGRDDAATREIEDKLTGLTDDATEMGFNFREDSANLGARTLNVTYGVVLVAVVVIVLSFVVLGRRIVSPLLALVDDLRALAGGDLTRRMHTDRRDEIGDVARSYNAVADDLGGMVQEVQGAAAALSESSNELSEAIERLTEGTQSQASALEQTTASIEEMTTTIKQTASGARAVDGVAADSRSVAERGGSVVRAAVSAMSEIDRSSARISEIITTIDEIAFQTNLLALNAAVEAARAGDHGRGFAVVASEVRNLSRRSADAAREIKRLIGDSAGKVEAGTTLVNQSGQALEEIVASVKRVTSLISDIAAASEEQAAGVDQVMRAVAQVDRQTQASAGQAEHLTATAHDLTAQAQQLEALVGRFKLEGEIGDDDVISEEPAPTMMSRLARVVGRRRPEHDAREVVSV